MADWPTGRLLSTASRVVEHAWYDALAALNLTHAGLIVLHLLEAGPLPQVDLARTARVEAQTMSRTIDRLERSGYVTRQPDAGDRRRRSITRTDEGVQVFERARRIESELFPEVPDLAGFRSTLLGIIRTDGNGSVRP